MRYEDDPCCQVGAYVHDGEALYRIVRLERAGPGPTGLRIWLEDAHGEQVGDEYLYRQRWLGAIEVRRSFKLARAAPREAGLPPVPVAA